MSGRDDAVDSLPQWLSPVGKAKRELIAEYASGVEAIAALVRGSKTLLWAMPCYGGVHPRVYKSHMAAMAGVAKFGIKVNPCYAGVTNKSGLVPASNRIAQAVVELGVDYVFWTEQDMDIPPDTLPRLLDRMAERPDIGAAVGVYFLRGTKREPQPCLYRKLNKGVEDYAFARVGLVQLDKFFRVDAAGMGCALFRGDVFKAITPPWFDDMEGRCGQDMYFYTQLWKRGIPVWCDTGVVCDQIDEDSPEVVGRADYEDYLRREWKSGPQGLILTDNPAAAYVPVNDSPDACVPESLPVDKDPAAAMAL